MAQDLSIGKNFYKYPRLQATLWHRGWLQSSTKSALVFFYCGCLCQCIEALSDSGGGTVDFQEFVGGLSAFSSRGGREEKLRCWSIFHVRSLHQRDLLCSCVQGIRCRPGRFHFKRGTVSGAEDDGGQQSQGLQEPLMLSADSESH